MTKDTATSTATTSPVPIASPHAESSGVHISIKAEKLFHVGGFPVTNGVLLSFILLILMSAGAILIRKRLALIPGTLQNIAETLIEGILSVMDGILGSRRESERYFPLIATLFIIVLFSNWFGLLPGVGSILLHGEETAPLFRAPSSDLNFTLALALITVVMVNILGITAIGIGPHIKKFVNFGSPIAFFTGILEFVSEIARIISFSFRLFGNIFAGEVLLTVISFLIPYVVPVPFFFLEVFVGFIQAFIFSMLALVFTGMAVQEHEQSH
ncbi:MAG: F0F1 ATP synthase subunit A [Candidatus Liptonbacteria bacterium]|nr:F0F1 ATP synthase subunit A [Candidatus Liptonbacteria bacterium]